jgi:hypothetical protein
VSRSDIDNSATDTAGYLIIVESVSLTRTV